MKRIHLWLATASLSATCGVLPAQAEVPAAAPATAAAQSPTATAAKPILSTQLSAQDAAARFGALPMVQQMSLSPDGKKVAFVVPVAGARYLVTADLAAGGVLKPAMRSNDAVGKLTWCGWVTNERLICHARYAEMQNGTLLGFTRNFAVNSDGSRMSLISAHDSTSALGTVQFGGSVLDWSVPDKPGSLLMTRAYVPEYSTGTHLANTREGLGVELVDALSNRRTPVEAPRRDAEDFITDGHGTVRIVATRGRDERGILNDRVRYLYRKKAAKEWELLGEDRTGEGFSPKAVDRDRDVAYGFVRKNGFLELHSMALDGTAREATVLARPGVDIDSLIRIGRSQRVVGASFATERRTAEFFDPALKRLGAALAKSLPGQPTIEFVDSSEDEQQLLIAASSDTDPGRTYLFDKKTRQLELVAPMRDKLEGLTLATMTPVEYPAADGTMIPGYLTLPTGGVSKGLPAIVMPHGGPSARDEWGFDWLVQFFAARGYAVLQPNFRGSSGYGSDWYQQNGFKSWRTAIGDVNDAGRWLLSQGIAAPGKLGIVGWSYGGYAALQTSVLEPGLFKAIVAVAPVTDLEQLRREAAEFTNARLVSNFIGQGEHVRSGSPAQNVPQIKAPVLMFHGDQDQNVSIQESRTMESRLRGAGKPVKLVEFRGLDHQLESSEARTQLLAESDRFLRTNLGIAP